MERRSITVRGIVQGVGFRPFVHGLASRLRLAGCVRNQTGSVRIEIEGEPAQLDSFLAELTSSPPPLARIEQVAWERTPPRGEHSFSICASEKQASGGPIFLSPDVAPCAACLAELFSPRDRRFRYPFLSCTHCGPRLTIITGAPYDRERTTMAGFPLCAACRAEYEDPGDRRYHAQPTACPACGPRLIPRDGQGRPVAADDPVSWCVEALRQGKIAAIKGVGGYHLACDARSGQAVRELRRRKHRDEKPFALMAGSPEAAAALCEVGPAERALLASPECPIVLLRRRPGSGIADEVAPGNPYLGVMLPPSPLHHLLLRAADMPLVMTSGNRSDEPIAHEDDDALTRLEGIADLFLMHDRPIHVRCDDSVTRVLDGLELPVRRSRGYAPRPIGLPLDCPVPILAVGGQLKGTFALGRERLAFLSHHLGDLDHLEAYRAFVRDLALYEELFAIRPALLAHDLHPDYASTGYARERAGREGLRLLGVQHHHAHLAACMAEHGLTGSVLGITFDGTGYGTDGTVWGGEILAGDYHSFRRVGHLRPVGMPGGEQAVREPWRMALAHLVDAGVRCPRLEARVDATARRVIGTMLARGVNTPRTSSAGRLFDAVASLIGLRDRVSHEGQAAMELEWLAQDAPPDTAYPFAMDESPEGAAVIDTRPLVRAVAEDVERGQAPARIARRFHTTLAEAGVAVCLRARQATGLSRVVLSGGVFHNALLTREMEGRLAGAGFQTYRHRLVPPGDGGLSLGQLAIAAAHAKRIAF